MKGYCMKCKKMIAIKDAQEVTLKNGRLAGKGICPICSTKMFCMLPKKEK